MSNVGGEIPQIAAIRDLCSSACTGTMAVSSPGGVGRTNRGLAHLVRGERMSIILDGGSDNNTAPTPRPAGRS